MKIEPEFSYYITNKEKATTEIIQKLNEIVKMQIETNISAYYQEFLNGKLSGGKIKKNDLLNLGQAKVLREILLTYFSINGSKADELDLKLGAVLPKVVDTNKKTPDILNVLKFEASLYEHLDTQTWDLFFNQTFVSQIKEDFNKKIRDSLEIVSHNSFHLFTMNLKLSRMQILGFTIGDIQLKDMVISWDLKNIIRDMSKIFDYLEIILGGFTRSKWTLNFIYALEPIWDPTQYKDITPAPRGKPKNMSEQEYNNIIKSHDSAVNQILSVDLVNWMKNRLIDTYDKEDEVLKDLQITTKYHPNYDAGNNFNTRLVLDSDIIFKLGEATFTLNIRGYIFIISFYSKPAI